MPEKREREKRRSRKDLSVLCSGRLSCLPPCGALRCSLAGQRGRIYFVFGLVLAWLLGQGVGLGAVGEEFLIIPSANSPAVAYDPVNQRFLMTYKILDSELRGQWLNALGNQVGSSFIIHRAPYGSVSYGPVVYDSVNHRFLVIWTQEDGIWGQLIHVDGTPFREKLRIVTGSQSAAVAYDPARERFLVVWGAREGMIGLYGRQVNADGTLFLKRELPLSSLISPGTYLSLPTLAYDSVNQRFLMAWWDCRNCGEYRGPDIYGLLLAGLPLKPLAFLSLNAQSFRPGDPLNLDVHLFTPPHMSPAGNWSFEAIAWLKTPPAFPSDLISIGNIGGPGNQVILPPGFGQSFPLLRFPAIPTVPVGSYKFGIRLNHPITRKEFSLDEVSFEVISP